MKICIVGSGIVGKSWAMVFTSAGYEVRIYDAFQDVLEKAFEDVKSTILEFEKKEKLKVDVLSGTKQIELISIYTELKEALRDVQYVQECVPENLELKRTVLNEIEICLSSISNSEAIIGSSSSALMASQIAINSGIKERILVVHPVNPPYLLKLVELVPSEWTSTSTTQFVKSIMEEAEKCPVVMKKEVPGFALNRIQYAIINETYSLVKNGVLTAEEADTVMKEGLAPRYLFMGPLETAHLNAEGFENYCDRYAETIHRVSSLMEHAPKISSASSKLIDSELQISVPKEHLPNRRRWRDDMLASLAQFKEKLIKLE